MRTRRNTLVSGIVVGTLALGSCGGGSDDASPPTVADAPVGDPDAPGDDLTVSDVDSASDTAAEQTTPASEAEDATVTTEPPVEPAADPASGAEAETAEDAAAPAPDSAPAAPVVGGRSLAAEVQSAAQFDANPFPDLIVEDIGKDTQVNVANILPSDRPVLLWAWAPH